MDSSDLMGGYSAYTTPAAARNDLVSIPDGTEGFTPTPTITISISVLVTVIVRGCN
ncbi:LxmA leader domain family RiPP [Kitasatospora sp. NPDC054768]